MERLRIGMMAFPDLTQLDLTGPRQVLTRMPGAEVDIVAKSLAPITSDCGLRFLPDVELSRAPSYDILFVPGGAGIAGAIADEETLSFVAEQGARAAWVTSVCTGALVLGAAGLLRGYRATTHWLSLDLLPIVGAIPVDERVVIDRNRVTGGGVTAGIDFALTLVAALRGEDVARRIQLFIEYDPAPPFTGSPRTAPPALVEAIRADRARLQADRRALLERTLATRGALMLP